MNCTRGGFVYYLRMLLHSKLRWTGFTQRREVPDNLFDYLIHIPYSAKDMDSFRERSLKVIIMHSG